MEQKLSDTLVKAIDRSNPMMQNLQLASRFNKLIEEGSGSGGGGSVTLYAWKEDFFGLRCYTYTDSPNVGDTFIYGAYGDVSSDIQIGVEGVLSVGENTIDAFLDSQRTYTRYPDGDIVLQAKE